MQIVSFVLAIVYCQANYSSIGICTVTRHYYKMFTT